jgi:VWFA-related protein
LRLLIASGFDRSARALALMTCCLTIADARGQQPPAQRAAGTVNERVTAVLVDVVVRDKHGQPVRDLTQADFQLTEDGVAQAIGSFTPIFEGALASAPATPAPAAAPTSPAAPAPMVGAPPPVDSGVAVTALVFDRLTPDARRRAVQAAQSYLGTNEETRDYMGIFGIDVGFTPFAPFTRKVRVLRQALAKMETRASASFNNADQDQRQARANADQQAASASQAVGAAQAAGGPGASSAVGGAPGDVMLAQMQSRMVNEFEVMERDQQGYSTTNGLFAIIGALGRLPGRKSLVLFSEGIAIPPAVRRLFLGVIDAANRANVTIYTMDAAGLRTDDEQAKIRDEVNRMGAGGSGILGGGGNADGGPLSKSLEKNEDVLGQDPHTGLGALAQETGGLLFDSTNNLRQGFDRVDSDLRNYYLLGYTPNNDTYDGRFRTIDVKVQRPGVTVAARKGYFALRNTGGGPVNSWEAPALGSLEQKPIPNAFPLRAGALLFPERDRLNLVVVVADMKTAPFTFETAADGKTYASDFAVLTRFMDPQNQVARKVSQHYEVKGAVADLERAKQGEVIFYREPELPPGVYNMETVAYDAPSGKSSVRFSTVEVPKEDAGKLRMSSLVIVKRTETVPERDRRRENPLLVNDVLIYPNLGEPVSKASKEVGFYFAVYPVRGLPPPECVLELQQNGTVVARLPMALAAVDASDRIQQVGRLPLDQLAPGTYDLRVGVKQGNEQILRSTVLRITN